jgi:hypothetical protein
MSAEGLVTPPLEQPSPVVSSHATGPYAEDVTGPSESSEQEEIIAATSKEVEGAENAAAISGEGSQVQTRRSVHRQVCTVLSFEFTQLR